MTFSQGYPKNFVLAINKTLNSHGAIVALLFSILFAFTVRLTPEILSQPWPIGYDTVGYARKISENYVWSNITNFMEISPLFYVIATPLAMFGDVFTILKIVAPALYGLLAAAVFTFAFYALGWKWDKALVCSLIFTLQLSALRLSWDLFRNELALIFMLPTLALLAKFNGTKTQLALFAIFSAFASFSHEMVAALLLIIVPAILGFKVSSRKLSLKDTGMLIVAFLPSIAYAIFLAFWGLYAPTNGSVNYEVPILFDYIGLGPYQYVNYVELINEHARFFFILFFPTLLLVILGIKRTQNLGLRLLTFVLIGLSFLPVISPYWSPAFSLRWMLMLAIPFSFYASEGLFKLHEVTRKYNIVAFLVALLIIPSLTFMVLPPHLSPLSCLQTEKTRQYLPSSLLSNTVSLEDTPDLLESLAFLNSVMNSHSLLVTHESFYEWARLQLQPEFNIVNSFKVNPTSLVETFSQSANEIYVLSWIDSINSWHGLTPPNDNFECVFSSGSLGVYLLRQQNHE